MKIGKLNICETQKENSNQVFLQICTFQLKAFFCNNTVFKLQCAVTRVQTIYGLLIFLNFLVLPVFFILFTYMRILIITFRSSREVRKKAAQTCLPHLIVLINYSVLCAYDMITVRVGSDFPKTVSLIMMLQLVIYHPLFNPIMYGLKMKEIYKQLKKLFCGAKVI